MRLSRSPLGLVLAAYGILYALLVLWIQRIAYRDPGSKFFRPDAAFEPRYSKIRMQQADEYSERVAKGLVTPTKASTKEVDEAKSVLCVGIMTVTRPGPDYLRQTIASLNRDLTPTERREIHLLVFIAQSDPSTHPASKAEWVSALTDEVVSYNLSEHELDNVRNFEKEREGIRAKAILDYVSTLQACLAAGAPYLAILEDDVIAMDGWYHRTINGLAEAMVLTSRLGLSPSRDCMLLFSAHGRGAGIVTKVPLGLTMCNTVLYLRLFYTEVFFGWNSQDSLSHVCYSIAFVCLCAILAGTLTRMCWPSTSRDRFPSYTLFALLATICPSCILLFFAAGRETVYALWSRPGAVKQMNEFGCCSQGLVWPAQKAAELIEWYHTTSPYGFSDALIEQYANDRQEMRWALTPSVIQHVGKKTSKNYETENWRWSRGAAEATWNFAFELLEPMSLQEEHARAVQGHE